MSHWERSFDTWNVKECGGVVKDKREKSFIDPKIVGARDRVDRINSYLGIVPR
jgi:hypothetical protein